MLKNYLKTALRNFWRQKTYSLINITGLSVGLACSFLIFLWVSHELHYDRFQAEGDQLYRVMRNYYTKERIYTWAANPMPLAKVLEEEYPEITHAVLINWNQHLLSSGKDNTFRERGLYAGPALFKIFTFPLLQGDPETALSAPDAIAISEGLAKKYFGPDWKETALGQSLTIDHGKAFTVTAIFKKVPNNSTIRFEFALPIEDYISRNKWLEHWGNNSLRLFVKLQKSAVSVDVNAKIKNIIRDHHESSNADVFLQPYLDIHLYSDFKEGKLVGGRIEYVQIFTVVALFILLIASINFMNLATARSAQRAREIGVRKAIGANQRTLIGQFMCESLLLTLFASILAFGMVILLLPIFNEVINQNLKINFLDPQILLAFPGIALVTGLVAGSYPAFYLSGFNPVRILRGTFQHRSSAGRLRQGLVIFQFGLSILLIIGTITVYRQITYIRNKNLGLDRENVVYLNLEGPIRKQFNAFKQELMQQPGIVSVTTSSQNPLSVGNSTTDPKWEGKDPETQILFHIINANYDFVETMKMNVLSGRAFSKAFATDSVNYIVNQQMARVMAMEDPVGQNLKFWSREGKIIGMVEDFHFRSLYTSVEPLIVRMDPGNTRSVYIRIAAGKTTEAIAGLETVFKKFNPGYPFEHSFLDERFERMYRSEMVMGSLATYFALLAVFISCLGLFGLASFTAEQRTKEIGIRKVLGASLANLVVLLSRDFIRLVVVAFTLSTPLAYYFMNGWLNDFAYHIHLDWSVFVVAGLSALFIAWLTVSYQAMKVASANPVESLRYE